MMITFKQQIPSSSVPRSYPWDDDGQHMPAERVEMSTYDEIDCRDLVDFFSRFAKALGYSPNSVYAAFEKYLEEHEFEIRGNE